MTSYHIKAGASVGAGQLDISSRASVPGPGERRHETVIAGAGVVI